MEKNTLTGWGMCPEHQKLKDDGYIALVGADPSKSEIKNGQIQPEGAHRIGLIAHIKQHTWDQIFNVPAPKDKVCFCEEELINHIQNLSHE